MNINNNNPLLAKLDSQFRHPFSDGAMEALKWLALIAMTSDHVNKVLFDASVPVMSVFGRLAMPIFGFIVAYNLARPVFFLSGAYERVLKRMFVFGLLATPFFALAFNKPVLYPRLNIMFALMLSVYIISAINKANPYLYLVAILSGVVLGSLVDYYWFGIVYCISAWYFCKQPSFSTASLWMAGAAILYFINGNFWALLAVPIIIGASRLEFYLPRLRGFFYWYYPIHIALLLAIHRFMVR